MGLQVLAGAFSVLLILQMSTMLDAQGINSCNVQIQQLRSQISLAASSSRLEISTAVQNNNNNISLARLNVQLQIGALRDKANNSSGPNAQICVNNLESALAEVNIDNALNLCNSNAAINSLNLQVNQINNLKGVVSQICNECSSQFPALSPEYDDCVSSKVGDIQSQLVNIQADISAGVADYQDSSNSCVQNAENNIGSVLNAASTDLDICIAAL